tara:strand:+ start:1177 stop:1332 length:156 start_codon:yes stop_codon:yes gene_type:complete
MRTPPKLLASARPSSLRRARTARVLNQSPPRLASRARKRRLKATFLRSRSR